MSMNSVFLRVSDETLEAYQNESQLLAGSVFGDNVVSDKSYIEIDQAWDGIIFLLTGSNFMGASGEYSKVFFSEQFVDEAQNLGYGPAHYLTSQEVSKLSRKLASLDIEELRNKFDPDEMEELEVYPGTWDEDGPALDYLIEKFEILRTFYADAAREGHAIISLIT